MTAKIQWQEHRERGNSMALRALRFAALRLGRRVIRPVLYPVALYFALTSSATRRVSREYLARVLPHPPRFRDVLRHIFSFASISLDRVFLLTNAYPFKVIDHYGEGCLELTRQRGALLFLSHFGSFEVMRVGAVKRHDLPLRIVLDLPQRGIVDWPGWGDLPAAKSSRIWVRVSGVRSS